MFTLIEFGLAMQAVRSPSMIATSMRQSTDRSKLFSIRDFERALVKLRNRQSKSANLTPAEVEPEVDEVNTDSHTSINKDDDAGGSADSESSSQEKANEELHTTVESTEKSQGQLATPISMVLPRK